MKLAELYPSKYLKASDLDGETVVTIADVTTETLKAKDGTEQEKPILLLDETKPVVMNRTNADAIATLYGPETDDWVGKQITLYVVEVTAFGETTDAIRVRSKAQLEKRKSKPAQPAPAHNGLGVNSPAAVVTYLKANGVEVWNSPQDIFKALREMDTNFKAFPAANDTGAWDTLTTNLLNRGMAA